MIYALINKKLRAFERLLQAPGIDLDQVDSIGCTILGIVMQYGRMDLIKMVRDSLIKNKYPLHNQYVKHKKDFKATRATSLI